MNMDHFTAEVLHDLTPGSESGNHKFGPVISTLVTQILSSITQTVTGAGFFGTRISTAEHRPF